ncbi:MAG: ACT domain-containing protein [Deferribacterales bacterium]
MDKNYYAITFVAEDRPGIVADVTKILYENGFNIEDSSSTLLRGMFAMILIVSKKEALDIKEVEDIFSQLNYMKISVKKVNRNYHPLKGDSYSISVYGADKAGIVYKVTDYLAKKSINIIDLQTKVAGKEDKPIYIMIMEIIAPEGLDKNWINDLKSLSKEVGVDISVKYIETYEF